MTRTRKLLPALRYRALLVILSLCWTGARAAEPATPEIDYSKFVLDNGLTLIVHEDHKAPIVAVNVWYHVGAKNEPPGKSGFAHLFEHLMFNGSEHYDDDYFKPFERVGATSLNGTTNSDRTNYFQNVPVTALDMALWMESDRMCCMNAAVTQARLDEQRGVVQNEKRQRENQPYGRALNHLFLNTYPAGHPYDATVIGSMEDLNAASLDDVHQWFDTYYGPSNAVLVVAGAVDTEHVRERVEHYFGSIPPGPPIARPVRWVAPRSDKQREVMQDRVPQPRVYRAYNVPAIGDPDLDRLQLFADVLANGKNSRLYETLVYERQIATDVGASLLPRELGSLLLVYATAQPDGSLDAVEQAMDAELQRLLEDGPGSAELTRVRTRHLAGFIRGVERVGGFGGKSDVLAQSEVYGGTPDAYLESLATIRAASAREVRDAARRWLDAGSYTLQVQPYPDLASNDQVVDRSAIPFPQSQPEVTFPSFERATLDNGLTVMVANWPAVPAVDVSLVLDAGYSADASVGGERKLGTASLTMDMLDEGAGGMTALEIDAALDRLGASLALSANLDTSVATLSALSSNLQESLELFADVVLEPEFPVAQLERLRRQTLAGIQQELNEPVNMALRLFPELIYGAGHAYAMPFTGSGTAQSVAALSRDDLQRYHSDWFLPGNATLIFSGDITLDEALPLAQRRFGGWQAGTAPPKRIPDVQPGGDGTIYVVDRPGSEQSVIIAGHVVPPHDAPDQLALEAASGVLGGGFTSRLNMNLREDKHWSYGARSFIAGARGPQPFFLYAPVQTDSTAAAMREMYGEISALLDSAPPTTEEVEKIKDQRTLTLPGRWETRGAVLDSLTEIVRYDLPDDYWDRYPDRVDELDVATVTEAARQHLYPERLTWVVVGDWQEIGASVRALDMGEIRQIEAR